MMNCERCHAAPTTHIRHKETDTGQIAAHDYCANCAKTLCARCMDNGCCGKVPADSGLKVDHDAEQGA